MDQLPTAGPGEPLLTHVDESGAARMVDVGDKASTVRFARAGARVWMAPQTMALLKRQALPKGDVLAVARVAGTMACKRTAELVPLCHPLVLDHSDVEFHVKEDGCCVEIECSTRTEGRTGVEMEAITGVSVAAITIYDMCKAVDRGMVIGDIRLLEKTGGKEDYVRSEREETEAGCAETVAGPGPAAAGPGPAAAGPLAAAAADLRDEAASPVEGRVVSVNTSPGKGERKKAAESVTFVIDYGIEGDGHAGPWHRQVSLLAQESIETMVAKGLEVGAGDFAENITTEGIDLVALPIGTRFELGSALVEVTQIGKVCHDRCAIYYQAGDCVMPREGIFVKVIRGGTAAKGDRVSVVGSIFDGEDGSA